MRQSWMLTAAMAGVLALAGCTENQKSIFRTFKIGNDESVVTDAKQRVVTNIEVTNTSPVLGQIEPSRVVCSEPSPDVAQVMSQAFDASLSVSVEGQGSGSGALGYSSAASLAQLGERLATIQLLRDELSSLCQSYANGAVSATTCTLRLSRLDRKMVTLLMSEMAAGAFGRNLAALTSAASAGGKSAELLKAEEAVTQAVSDVDDRRNELVAAQAKTPKDDAAIATAQDNLLKAYQALAKATSEMLALEMTGAGSGALASALGMPGAIERDGGDETGVGQLVSLQGQFLDDDEIGTLIDACVSATNLMTLPRNADGSIDFNSLKEFQSAAANTASQEQEVEDADFLLERQIKQRGDVVLEIAELEAEIAALELEFQGIAAGEPREAELQTQIAELRRVTDGYRSDLEGEDKKIADLRAQLVAAAKDLAVARAERARFMSPLGQYCVDSGLDHILEAVKVQNDHQIDKLEVRKTVIEAETEQMCVAALSAEQPNEKLVAYCEALLEARKS